MISYLMTMVIIINGLFQGAHKLEGSGLACGACGDGDARLRKVIPSPTHATFKIIPHHIFVIVEPLFFGSCVFPNCPIFKLYKASTYI